jgi:hypothetical protein
MPPKQTDPHILDLPVRAMAVVTTVGDPNDVAAAVMPALYGAVYTLKFARKKAGAGEFKVEALRARWPDAHEKPKDAWTAYWALPIPDDVTELVQKVPGVEVRIERWAYGTVAQILHLGPFSEEGPTVARLHAFIAEQGLTFAGPHEEEYLTKLDAKAQKTIIRYQVRPK